MFTGFSKFVKESYRILKDNGILIINTCSPEQAEKCWMGAGLAPIGGKAMAISRYVANYEPIRIKDAIIVHYRLPPIATVLSEVAAAGYTIQSVNLHCYPSIYNQSTFTDKDGPFSESWRALDR